jgi:trans-aconitate 2-methyltransferase
MSSDWAPELYLKFADERSRPAADLLAHVTLAAPRLVYDLGCGPGNSTALLVSRYPEARVIGLDNSPAMLAKARESLPAARFEAVDLTQWMPDPAADLLFSNATFQWLPAHADVMERCLAALRPGGLLALQMPDNLNEPSHALMRQTAAQVPWSTRLTPQVTAREAVLPVAGYYNRLKPWAAAIDIWHTVYTHVLADAGAIVTFLSSTGLRPFLDPLMEDERKAFLADYRARLEEAYPAAVDGKVLLRFPRLFIIARRG